MCGRYALYGPTSRLREQFGVEPDDRLDRYNIAPTQQAPVIRSSGSGPELVDARWGLVPSWAKDPAGLAHPINAKLETAAEKPMFRHAFKRGRVLVPASAFYEWQPGPDHKQPYCILPRDGGMFAFGGLLEQWASPEGTIWTFAILTTAANELMRPIHDRMPVIIDPANYGDWLDPELMDAAAIHRLAEPFPSDRMRAHPVGRAVGNPRSQGPQLVQPLVDE